MLNIPSKLFRHGACLLLILSLNSASAAAKSVTIPMKSTNYGTSLNIEVEIGGSTFNVIPDSGSADLWVFGKGEKRF